MTGAAPQGRTWRQLIDEAACAMRRDLGGDRRREAQWLVERVAGLSAADLLLHGGDAVSSRSVGFFDRLLARRCAGEPLQYVLGRWSFRSLELHLDRSVLIPRPETEVVAGVAIDVARRAHQRKRADGQDAAALDLGTGSGAIALSLATEVAGLEVVATDASPGALAVARANLAGLGRAAARVSMHEGSWFEAVPARWRGRFDVIVANPPYIGTDEADGLPAEVRDWEPATALFAGPMGTDALAHLVTQAPVWLAGGGVLVLEMAPAQTDWARDLAGAVGFAGAHIIEDLAGKPRALVATWKASE
jgi:release factor glutamine methyltransferase